MLSSSPLVVVSEIGFFLFFLTLAMTPKRCDEILHVNDTRTITLAMTPKNAQAITYDVTESYMSELHCLNEEYQDFAEKNR